MSLPNLSGLAHTPPRPTGKVLTVEDVKKHPDRNKFAAPDTDEKGNPKLDENGQLVLMCTIMNERFFASDAPEELVVAVELDNCKHVFHGSYLCTKVFGASVSDSFPDGVESLWDTENGDWVQGVDPPCCDFCRKPFAFSNIRELVEKVEACDVKKILGDAYPRFRGGRDGLVDYEDDWKQLKQKYDKLLTAYVQKNARAARVEARQERTAIGMSTYGMDAAMANSWARTYEDASSDEAIAAGEAIRAAMRAGRYEADAIQRALREEREQADAMDVDATQDDPSASFRAQEVFEPGDGLTPEEERAFLAARASRENAERVADTQGNDFEAAERYRQASEAIALWAWADNLWWGTPRREIVRTFHHLNDHRFEEGSARADLQLYKAKDFPLSAFADSHPKWSPFHPVDPDVYESSEEGAAWEALYTNMMRTCVPHLFGADGYYGGMARVNDPPNQHFLKHYVEHLGLSSISLNRVKEANRNGWHDHAAWFLPHPSCWLTAPIRASGKHVDALCTPPLAAKLINQERAASLSMWSWGGDPSMPKEIDLQAQLERHFDVAWDWLGTGQKPTNKDPMKHMFHLEYDDPPQYDAALWPRCCHLHVGVALDSAVREPGVVYLAQVPAAEGGGCRRGYTLFTGPPLEVTLSVPYSEGDNNAMPMARDVADFLANYTYNSATELNRIKQMYGLSGFDRHNWEQSYAEHVRADGGTELRRFDDPLLEDYTSRREKVQVIKCQLDGLRYQIRDDDPTRIANAQNEQAHFITVPIEAYLQNGIAVLLRDHQGGGMVARAFGMGPRMQWQGRSERQPSDAHNRQGVLAAMLSNDRRERETWFDWLSPVKYKIRGVVKGRTVVMRDRPRHRELDADGTEQIDPTDPSQTEPSGSVHRRRERYSNLMACAELVLENDQFFMPWQR